MAASLGRRGGVVSRVSAQACGPSGPRLIPPSSSSSSDGGLASGFSSVGWRSSGSLSSLIPPESSDRPEESEPVVPVAPDPSSGRCSVGAVSPSAESAVWSLSAPRFVSLMAASYPRTLCPELPAAEAPPEDNRRAGTRRRGHDAGQGRGRGVREREDDPALERDAPGAAGRA